MSEIKKYQKVHTVSWLGHGVVSIVCALLLYLLEVVQMDALKDMADEHAQLQFFLDILYIAALYKIEMLVYGFVCVLMIGIYHFKARMMHICMNIFVGAQLPISVYVTYALWDMLDIQNEYYYTTLSSMVVSELTMLVCLVLSLKYMALTVQDDEGAEVAV